MQTSKKALYENQDDNNGCTCLTCNHSWKEKYITDNKGTRYKMMKSDCKAKNVVYIIHCAYCKENYIGMTTSSLKTRFAQHVSSIRNKKNTSISDHFNSPNHNYQIHLKLALLDKNVVNKLNLRMREGYWIRQFQTTSRGINRREESSSIIDYQILSLISHLRHSKTCFPYCLYTTEKIETLQLQQFKRIIIPGAKRH